MHNRKLTDDQYLQEMADHLDELERLGAGN